MLVSQPLSMSASKGSLLEKTLASLDDPSELLEAHDIKQSEIDDMIRDYGNEKALETQIARWRTVLEGNHDPQGKVAKVLAKGIAALSKMQKSSNWKAQVRSFSQKPKSILRLFLHC